MFSNLNQYVSVQSVAFHRNAIMVLHAGLNIDVQFLLFCIFSFSMAKMATRRIRLFHPCSFAMFAVFPSLLYVAHIFTDADIFSMSMAESTKLFVRATHRALFLILDAQAFRSAFVCVR